MIPRFALGFLAGIATLLVLDNEERNSSQSPTAAPGHPGPDHPAEPQTPDTEHTANGPALEDVLGAITHDVRSPAAIILGYLELLADGVIGDPAAGGIDVSQRIRSAIQQLTDLADGLEILATPPGPTDDAAIADLADAAHTALRSSAREAENRRITLDLDPAHSCPVRARPADLERTIRNLFSAALRDSASRRITVRTEHDADSASLVLAGAHIDPDTAAAALDSSRPAAHGTAGLRLLVARHAARSFGGTIRFEAGELRLRAHLPSGD